MSNPENHAVQRSNKILTSSAVPTILVLVLIWMTAAVLLTLSVLSQRDFSILKKGDSAPFSTWALTDFSYIDKAKTNAEKAAARKSIIPSAIHRAFIHFLVFIFTSEKSSL